MSDTNRQDDWQAEVLGELTGTGPAATPPPQAGPAAGPGQGHRPADAAQAAAAQGPGRPYPAPGGQAPHADPARAAVGTGPDATLPPQVRAVPGGQVPHVGPGRDQWPAGPGGAAVGTGSDATLPPQVRAVPGGQVPHVGPGRDQWPAGPGGAAVGTGSDATLPPQVRAVPGGQVPHVGPGRDQWPAGPGGAVAGPGPGQAHPPRRQATPAHAHAQAGPETVLVRGAGAPAGRSRHGDPLLRRTLRGLRGALGASAAKAVATGTGLAAQVQQPVTTGRQIVVTSIRGGSGKTTVTALLSRTYNHFRHDPVLTLEADAALGTLPVRLGVESLRWTCGDLARIVRPSMQLTDVTGYLVPLTDGGWLLPGSQGRIGAQVDVAAYRTVTVALRRYFGVTVVDCETLPGEVARTALDTAHARVLTTPATAEGLESTRAVLDWLGSLPVPVLPRTVVVIAVQSPHPAVDFDGAAETLAATGAGVVVLPYDRHLASGGPVRTELLGVGTRQAAVRLAAEVLQRAVALPAPGGAR